MRKSPTRRARCLGGTPLDRTPTICVVDPHIDDYQGWRHAAEAHGVKLQIVASAEEALRLSGSGGADQWVVNADLPGLSGCELCAMLKSRDQQARVLVVAEHYSAELERSALSARATMFAVKPTQEAWLDQCLARRERQWTGRCG